MKGFLYTDYYYCIGVFAYLVPLNFLCLESITQQLYNIYIISYFVVFILIIIPLLVYSEPKKTTDPKKLNSHDFRVQYLTEFNLSSF